MGVHFRCSTKFFNVDLALLKYGYVVSLSLSLLLSLSYAVIFAPANWRNKMLKYSRLPSMVKFVTYGLCPMSVVNLRFLQPLCNNICASFVPGIELVFTARVSTFVVHMWAEQVRLTI